MAVLLVAGLRRRGAGFAHMCEFTCAARYAADLQCALHRCTSAKEPPAAAAAAAAARCNGIFATAAAPPLG